MSHANVSIASHGNALDGFVAPFRKLIRKAVAIGRYRQTLNALAELDDRVLADLGLTRSSIKSVAHDAAIGRN